MTVDDKLKSWREGTESLAPSDALLAKLAASVEAAPAAAAPATASGFAVKVIVVVVAIGAAVVSFWVRPGVESRAVVAPAPAPIALTDQPAGEAACPPRPNRSVSPGVPALMLPRTPDWEREQAKKLKALRIALEHRPLTCEAQQEPIRQLLREGAPNERARLMTRYVFFCGSGGDFLAAHDRFEPGSCDDSDWCHAPKCEGPGEACGEAYAARPAGSCNAALGHHVLSQLACERFIRGTGTQAEVKARRPDAWCLDPSALAEAEKLRRTVQGDAQ